MTTQSDWTHTHVYVHVTLYIHMLPFVQVCLMWNHCTVSMCTSICMAGDYACTYSFWFTVDCSGHITCTKTCVL